MIIFKLKDKDVYLVTNFKVMFSTLKNQDNLLLISQNKKLLLHVIMSWFLPKSKFYLIVRNPFDRIISFYKSKFLNAEFNRLWMRKNEKGHWQKCTEHFFPELNLSTKTSPKQISKVLESTSFKKMLSILPKVYQKDGHMTPQYYAKKFRFYKYGHKLCIPIKFEKIFKIEHKQDLQEIESIFGIDLSINYNPTNHITEKVRYDVESTKLILNIYQKDFEDFNYSRTPSNC